MLHNAEMICIRLSHNLVMNAHLFLQKPNEAGLSTSIVRI